MRIATALAALAMLTAPLPAKAGTIVITVTTASGVCATPCTKTYTDTDANLAKVIPAYQSGCNTSINGTCTSLQVLKFWFDGVIKEVVANVAAFDKNNLANTATGAYVPINPN